MILTGMHGGLGWVVWGFAVAWSVRSGQQPLCRTDTAVVAIVGAT